MPMIVKVPENRRMRRRRGYARAMNMLDRKQTAVQRQLRRGGLASYEPGTQATLLALVEVTPDRVEFFDIGANIGLYSTLISVVFGPEKVRARAFEPTPATARIARRVARANGVAVLVEEIALSSTSGRAPLYISAKADTSNSLVAGFREAVMEIEVPVTTLDEYCETAGAIPGVVKIDVETLEAAVLRGGLETFRRHRPAIIVEFLPGDHLADSLAVLGDLLAAGYVAHRMTEAGVWLPTGLGDVPFFVSETQRDWLLTHGALPDGLVSAQRRWEAAIRRCTKDTNVFVPAGTPLPSGWNDPYQRRGGALGRLIRRINARS